MFNVVDQRPLWILKNAWRNHGRLKVSEIHGLMQKSDGPFKSAKALAKFIVGGDFPLDNSKMVTIGNHRAQFSLRVIGTDPQSIDSFCKGVQERISTHENLHAILARWDSFSFSTCCIGQPLITLCEAYELVASGDLFVVEISRHRPYLLSLSDLLIEIFRVFYLITRK